MILKDIKYKELSRGMSYIYKFDNCTVMARSYVSPDFRIGKQLKVYKIPFLGKLFLNEVFAIVPVILIIALAWSRLMELHGGIANYLTLFILGFLSVNLTINFFTVLMANIDTFKRGEVVSAMVKEVHKKRVVRVRLNSSTGSPVSWRTEVTYTIKLAGAEEMIIDEPWNKQYKKGQLIDFKIHPDYIPYIVPANEAGFNGSLIGGLAIYVLVLGLFVMFCI